MALSQATSRMHASGIWDPAHRDLKRVGLAMGVLDWRQDKVNLDRRQDKVNLDGRLDKGDIEGRLGVGRYIWETRHGEI